MAGFIVQPQVLLGIGPNRSFGGYTGYVTITENTIDEIEITQQPVQQGANIADHAFKKPGHLAIQIKTQELIPAGGNFITQALGSIVPQSLNTIYQQLLSLQSSFIPFTVTTPKRTYFNMLFKTLGQTTDKSTENCLAINAAFEYVLLVPIGITTVPRSSLRNPGSNGATQAVGNKSALATIFGPPAGGT